MGTIKYLPDIERLFAKSLIVQASSISRLVKYQKKVRQYDRHVLRNLIRQGKIRRLMKGHYTSRHDPSLAVFCFQPAYLGCEDALSIQELWEQETIPVVCTVRKVRTGLRKVMGMNVLVRRIPKELFFGFEYKTMGEMVLPYSDKEKTILDMLYFRKNLEPKEVKSWLRLVDRKKLKEYLKQYPKKVKEKVQGFLR